MFRTQRKWLSAAALTAVIALAVTGCSGASDGGSADTDEPILIGGAMSLTGDFQITGTGARAAAEYAVQEINEAGGLLGRQVELDIRDDQSKPDQAAVAFQDLADDVDVFIGPSGSNSAVAVLDFVERQQIPMVASAATSEQVDPVHDWIYQAPTSGSDVGTQMGDYVVDEGYSSVFGIVNKEEAGLTEGWDAMKSGLEESDVAVAGVAEVSTTTTDYSAAIAQAQSSGAEIVAVMVAGPPALAFATQYASSGNAAPVIMTNAVASDYFVKGGGEDVNGTLVAAALPVVTDSLADSGQKTAMAEMIEGFTQETGAAPDAFAYHAYTAMQVIFAAIEKAGSTDHQAVRDALSTLEVDTVIGPIEYSDTNHGGPGAEYIAITKIADGEMIGEPWSVTNLDALFK